MATKKKAGPEPTTDPGAERLAPTDPLTADVRGTTLAPSDAVVLLREYGGAAEWPLDRTRHAFTLGSGQVDVVVPRQYVSRQHVTMRRDEFWLDVRNLSQNGTYFGGQPHDRAPVKAGDRFTVGTTTLLALDDFMITATSALRRQLGREAYAAVDDALIAIVRWEQPALALTGPHGTEPERLARAIHAASPRRDLPFEVIDVLTTRLAVDAAITRVGGGSMFVDLRPLREKKVTAAMQRALLPAATPQPRVSVGAPPPARVPATRPRLIVAAPTLDRVYAAFDTKRVQFDEIATPALSARAREVVGLLDELMAEQGSPVRASQLPLDRQAAISRYAWPGNQDELRTAAIRIGAYLASASNLSAAARALGLHHSTLRESLERCGAVE